MKGSPRSIMLTWVNRAAGWWTSAAANAMRQQQNAFLNAIGVASLERASKIILARHFRSACCSD